MKLTFWGAAGTVTGSMHEVNTGGLRLLLDCGLFQGRRKDTRERNMNLAVAPNSIDTVLLSHAHIDHSGNLPSLAKGGYEGPVYATSATADLCGAMLRDSAYIQQKDADFLNKRHRRRKKLDRKAKEGPPKAGPIEPLHTIEDAEKLLPLFRTYAYREAVSLSDDLTFETRNVERKRHLHRLVRCKGAFANIPGNAVGAVLIALLAPPAFKRAADVLLVHQRAWP